MKLTTTTIVQILAVLVGIAGVLADEKVIPGIPEATSVAIIGGAAAIYKVGGIIEKILAGLSQKRAGVLKPKV